MARQDFYKDAIQAFEEVIKLDPLHKVAWIHCGYCAERLAHWTREEDRRLKLFKKSLKCYKEAIDIDQEDGDAWFNLGNAYRYLNQFENAIKAYETAININPQDFDAHYNMSICYENLASYQEAINCIKKALEINPSNERIQNNLRRLEVDKEIVEIGVESAGKGKIANEAIHLGISCLN
ncbi:MAG: tetratricopeptide repeat protein, partial [Promethearchaeota archaeon]